jgi:hypothetical protein
MLTNAANDHYRSVDANEGGRSLYDVYARLAPGATANAQAQAGTAPEGCPRLQRDHPGVYPASAFDVSLHAPWQNTSRDSKPTMVVSSHSLRVLLGIGCANVRDPTDGQPLCNERILAFVAALVRPANLPSSCFANISYMSVARWVLDLRGGLSSRACLINTPAAFTSAQIARVAWSASLRSGIPTSRLHPDGHVVRSGSSRGLYRT